MPHSVFPLSLIPSRDAIVGYLLGKNNVVHWYDRPILTPSRTDLRWPSVIVTNSARKFMNKVQLNKETLYYRDSGKCFLCDRSLTTQRNQTNSITDDHVVPRAKGGKTEWTNVVASCPSCNLMKGAADPIGKWAPKKKIFEPSFYQMLEIRKKYPMTIDDEFWEQFLPGFAPGTLNVNEPKFRLIQGGLANAIHK